jgi:hypothetical protein
MRLLLLILIACTALPSHAGKLFICRDASGQRRELRPAVPTAAAKAAADTDAKQIAAWEQTSRARLPASLGGNARPQPARGQRKRAQLAPDPRAAREASCRNARAARTRAERERSFQMGFDERRRLSDAELSACGLR